MPDQTITGHLPIDADLTPSPESADVLDRIADMLDDNDRATVDSYEDDGERVPDSVVVMLSQLDSAADSLRHAALIMRGMFDTDTPF